MEHLRRHHPHDTHRGSRRTLARRARLVGVALFVVAAATGCNGVGPVGRSPVATVNGHEISLDEVQDLMRAQERFYEAERKKAAGGGGDTSQLDGLLGDLRGTGTGTLGTAGAASALSQLISYQAVVDELSDDGVKVTDADRKTVRDAILEQVGGQAELDKLDKEFVDFTVRTQAATAALQAQLAKEGATVDREAQIKDLYEQTKAGTPLCLNLILAADQAAGTSARARVDAGEDFGAVAEELSQDPSTAANGGYAGCATPETAAQSFPADYGDVEVGDVLGPITIEAGVVVIQVDSTTGPELERVRDQLEAQLDQQGTASEAALAARLDELLDAADVTVDPRYGRWDATTATVLPPADPGRPSVGSESPGGTPATGDPSAPAGS